MRTWRAVLAVGLTLGLVTAGCGNDDDDAADETTTTAAAPKEPPVIEIHAADEGPDGDEFKFSLPGKLSGGVVTLRLTNDGKERHDFQLAKSVPGHTLEELLKQVGSEDAPLEQWVVAAGGIGGTAPGETNEATLDLEPGTYWYFCTESSGEGKDHKSHATHGMSGELTLADDSGAALPEKSGSITATEYSFATEGLKAGENTITFGNDGKQVHHALLFPVAAGTTFDKAKEALLSDEEPAGPPPIDFEHINSTAVIDPGQRIVYTADLKAGTYVLACFMPDKGTAGPPHAVKGMMTEVKIA
ncbi:MAG TPA: hypothetical protein VM030_08730 [Acidimicrobiales bacterium]|nr:hypothetical protein [Acidimicrobiales bacterium]